MRRPLVCALLGLALLAGCSSADEEPADEVPEAGSGRTTAAAAGGCPAGGEGVPEGADEKPTVDVDGDGADDVAWIAGEPGSDGGVTFGVTTASGATATAVLRSDSAVAPSVLVADVTGQGEVVALASDGGRALLYTVSDCRLLAVQDDQGAPFAFDLGAAGVGTGVGCADADGDGVRDLLGLVLQPPAGEGAEAQVQQTIVELDGTVARAGATSAAPAGDEVRQQEVQSVTCGDLRLDTHGVTSGA
jgi:hypothetical protein